MKYQIHTITAMLALLLFAPVANAAYTLTPLCGGNGSKTINPGESFTLDMVLSSDASDTSTSADFNVVFSAPGLRYDNYNWYGSYATSIDDYSQPGKSDLPLLVDLNSYQPPYDPLPQIDLYFNNYVGDLPAPAFGTGKLVSLDFTVPADYTPGTVTISVQPNDFRSESGDPITTTAGADFQLNIVPEPSAMILLAVSAALAGMAILPQLLRRLRG